MQRRLGFDIDRAARDIHSNRWAMRAPMCRGPKCPASRSGQSPSARGRRARWNSPTADRFRAHPLHLRRERARTHRRKSVRLGDLRQRECPAAPPWEKTRRVELRVHRQSCFGRGRREADQGGAVGFQAPPPLPVLTDFPEQSVLAASHELPTMTGPALRVVRQHLLGDAADRKLGEVPSTTDLSLAFPLVQSRIDKDPSDLLALDQLPLRQLQQRLSGLNVQCVVQLVRRIPRWGLLDKTLAGVQQRPVLWRTDAWCSAPPLI